MNRPAILLFARSPEREAVAKRMPFAAPLFRALVASWLAEAERLGATPVIACAAADRDALAAIAPEIEREWIEQHGASFGERAANAADEAFARGCGGVLVAAIDAPPQHAADALHALSRGLAAVSPSRDGGINFIALPAPDRHLLESLAPRRRDLLQLCRRHLRDCVVVGGTIDVDSPGALEIARRDRAWRALLPPIRIAVAPPPALVIPRGVARPHCSRPPPA